MHVYAHTNYTLRLWDYFNNREEETLESLVGVPTPRGGGNSSNERSLAEQQQESSLWTFDFQWLNIE